MTCVTMATRAAARCLATRQISTPSSTESAAVPSTTRSDTSPVRDVILALKATSLFEGHLLEEEGPDFMAVACDIFLLEVCMYVALLLHCIFFL